MRAVTLFPAVLAAALFSACTGSTNPDPNCNGPDCTPDDCPECPTDPGNELATVQLNFSIRDNPVECQLYGNDEFIGATNVPHQIEPGTYEFAAGSDGVSSTDGLPLHPFDGMNWGCKRRPADTLAGGKMLVIECDANVVFAGNFTCTSEVCMYDAGTEDGKGTPCDPVENEGPTLVEILDGFKVESEMSLLNFGSDQLLVSSDHFAIEGDEWIVHNSLISSNGFHVMLIDEIDRIHDIECALVP